jgi:hypothetical protein
MSTEQEGLQIQSYMNGERVRSRYAANLTGNTAKEIGQIMGCMIKTASDFAKEMRDAVANHSADAAEEFDTGMNDGLESDEVRSNATIAMRAVKLPKRGRL